MTPNLRLNRKITKQIINASPRKENQRSLMNINWEIDNHKAIFGLRLGFIKKRAAFLQKMEENRFRLVVPGKGILCNFYIIDNIEDFINLIGIEQLDMLEPERIAEALKETSCTPNTGIIMVIGDELYVYDHSNY